MADCSKLEQSLRGEHIISNFQAWNLNWQFTLHILPLHTTVTSLWNPTQKRQGKWWNKTINIESAKKYCTLIAYSHQAKSNHSLPWGKNRAWLKTSMFYVIYVGKQKCTVAGELSMLSSYFEQQTRIYLSIEKVYVL